MKRICSLLLALVMVVSLIPAQADAAEPAGGFAYDLYGDHAEITAYLSDEARIEIPKTIEGLPVTAIGQWAFSEYTWVTDVTLPDTLTSIGSCAFYHCTGLAGIYFSGDAPEIAYDAFAYAEATVYYPANNPTWAGDVMQDYEGALTWVVYDPVHAHEYTGSVVAPTCEERGCTVYTCACGHGYRDAYVDALGHDFADNVCTRCSRPEFVYVAYADHVKITGYNGSAGELTVPSELGGRPVTVIDGWAFSGCASLTNVILPDSVTVIGDYVFYDCANLVSIRLPEGITAIGDALFYGCGSLTDVQIPDAVASIGDMAFCDCVSLAAIDLPDGITAIGEAAFDNCAALESIEIPDTVTSIGETAFRGCIRLETVDLSQNLTSIGEYAFSNCENLNYIIIPEGVTAIPDGAFENCCQMTTIELPGSIASIGQYAFASCTSVFLLVLPEGLKIIEPYAFAWCYDLVELEIPASAAEIRECAFGWCYSLNTIRFRGSAPALAENTLKSVTATAHYPASDSTWTENVMQDYGGTITWVAYDPTAPVNPFTDVPAGCWYEAPIMWALENGVTSGSSETTFSPGDKCLRAHVVTFLWNAEKCPEPAAAASTFTDVPAGAWYEKPVLWAVENGITSGVSDTKFGAGDVCSRYQVVFFLWKAAGSPEPKTTVNPFTDVNPGHFFYKAVLWAVENGITSGTSATTFGPTAPCNRAQVVTFLYAAYN